MNKPDWDRIQEIFCAALEQPRSERKKFVEEASAGNMDLQLEVISLLEAHDSLGFPEPPLRPELELVGSTVAGRYYVEREFPPGGMGRVFYARDLQLPGRFVIIKILPPAWSRDPDAVRRFKREIAALSRVDDPDVVSALGTGELSDADATPYIVMQYVDGLTLRSQVEGGMDPARVASIFQQIGVALAHVHQKGILHLDLKPENIMLQVLGDGREHVKVLDFGIAKIKDSLGATGAVNTVAIGTQAYMSPEQFRAGATLTAASDVYSMAIVACEMLTGERPFDPNSVPQIQRHTPPVNLPARIPKKAQQVLLRALSFEPKDRYQNAKQFGDDLANALLNGGPETGSINGWPWRYIKRIAVIAGGLAIVSVLSFGVYKYCNQPPPARKGFDYWLMVQKMRDAKEYGEPSKSNGADTFDPGDKFQLNVSTLKEPGNLYIFNEGPPAANSTSFRLIYPKKDVNNGSATIGADQTVQSEWITFRGSGSAENIWMVWSASPVPELEAAKNQALAHPDAGLIDENLMAVKEFLKTTQAKIKVRDASYKDGQVSKVRASSDLVLTLAQFEPR